MKNNKFLEVLFSTKNNSKILKEYNNLCKNDKINFLSIDKVKNRLNNIIKIDLLFSMLIDLPFDFRINFLNNINTSKFQQSYEKMIIDFLKLQNYEEFNIDNIKHFINIKDKQIILLIFRYLSFDKLKAIILQNYCQFINDYAFMEYSKKCIKLTLEPDIINNISDDSLNAELKRRKKKENCTTNVELSNFLKFDSSKQSCILTNGDLNIRDDSITEKLKEKYLSINTQEKISIFNKLIEKTNYIKLLELQVLFSTIDDKTALELMKILFKKIYNFEHEVEDKYLNSMIYNFRCLNSKTKELYKLLKQTSFSIIYYLNTGIIDSNILKYLSKNITIEQYQKTNVKKINKISNLLNLMFEKDKTKAYFIDIEILTHKLYYIFGYENTIELLNQKFGAVDLTLLDRLLNRCNINNVEFEKMNNNYEPIINKSLIQFLIGDKKDNNTTIKRILRGELNLLVDEFSNLYNNFERFQNKIGKKIHLNKLIPLLKESPYILLPNEYKLTKDIIDNIIKSYRYNDINENNNYINNLETKEWVLEACKFYHEYLEKRIISSIPRVYGITNDNYSYEVLKLDNPIIMTLGYITRCCFRLNGESREFLKYCSKSLHARVVVIRNPMNEICSMIPIIRNGNVIAGNSIESNYKGGPQNIYDALKNAFDDIIKVSNEYEENPIIAGCVTNLHSNAMAYSNKPISKRFSPISDTGFYNNYNAQTCIVSILSDKSEKDFVDYTPAAIYLDERPNILEYYYEINNPEIKYEIMNRINSINYIINKQEDYIWLGNYTICSEDWYIKVHYKEIYGQCLQKDPRAIEEYNTIMQYLKTYLENNSVYNISSNEFISEEDGINSLKSKQLILKKNTNENSE